jgi:hypothetical protein
MAEAREQAAVVVEGKRACVLTCGQWVRPHAGDSRRPRGVAPLPTRRIPAMTMEQGIPLPLTYVLELTAASHAEEGMPHYRDPRREPSREERDERLEYETHHKDANVEALAQYYMANFSEKPILRLLQDLGSRSRMYSNLLEEIKRIHPEVLKPDQEATNLKEKYERFGLVPKGFLPNPTVQSITQYIMDKLASLARAILDVVAKYATRIAEELRISPEITITFQVGASGWSPDVTVGIERSGSWGRAGPMPVR